MTSSYIVIGFSKRDSRAIIGRYKSPDELRDVFVADRVKRSVKRSSLLFVFRETSLGDREAFRLVTFDLKSVSGKRSGRERKPTAEYTAIKRYMLFKLCAWVDMSTYICPELVELEQLIKSLGVLEYRGPVYYSVVPFDEKAREYLRECFTKTLNYIRAQVLSLISRVEGADKRANKLRAAAESVVSAIWELQVIFNRNKSKFERIGLDASLLSGILEDAVKLEKAVREKWS